MTTAVQPQQEGCAVACTMSYTLEPQAKKLNKWDVYPILSTLFSGPLRILVSLVQLVVGTSLTLISILFGWLGTEGYLATVKKNLKEVVHGAGNFVRGTVAMIPLLGNLAIYLYNMTPLAPYTLKRDSNGLYTLPKFEVPGFKNAGIMRSSEFNIRKGDFVIDTKNGIVPEGWVLEN